MNRVIIIGRLCNEPTLKFLSSSGIAVANFTLAVDRPYTNAEGKSETDFIPVICWRKLAEHVANNLNKGRLVAVSGAIQTRKYQAQDGSTRYVTEVVADEVKFLDWPKDKKGNQGNIADEFVEVDEELPF